MQISGVAAICLQELARLLLQVAGNPKQPQFAYYMFESIAAILKHCPITEAEERLFPAFNILLQQDVQVVA
jgi:exportin-2 (importin alpha re-exporter)